MEKNQIENYKLERTSWVKAVYYDGDNEDEITTLLKENETKNITFAKAVIKIKKTHQGKETVEDVPVLLLSWQDKKDNFKKLTIHEGMFFIAAKSFRVMEKEKFLERYEYVKPI